MTIEDVKKTQSDDWAFGHKELCLEAIEKLTKIQFFKFLVLIYIKELYFNTLIIT